MTDTALTIEICSGPLDGTGVQVSGDSFTVGHDASCDVALPDTPGTPATARVVYRPGPGGSVVLAADCELEHDGTTSRTVEGTGETLIVRLGATDLALRLASTGDPDTAEAGPDPVGGAADGERQCSVCGQMNAAGSRWCARCGRDL